MSADKNKKPPRLRIYAYSPRSVINPNFQEDKHTTIEPVTTEGLKYPNIYKPNFKSCQLFKILKIIGGKLRAKILSIFFKILLDHIP